MNQDQGQITRTCRRCGVVYEGDQAEAFFRKIKRSPPRKSGSVYIQNHCRGCEQNQNDQRKRARRSKKKAENTRRDHCRKHNKNFGTSFTIKEFGERFHWDIEQMAHDIEYTYGNGCPVCREDFEEMGHGLRDVTIDIINPEVNPVYGVNTRWICFTCNTEKQRTPMRLWAAKQQAWRKWRKRQEELKADPYIGTLFEGIEVNGQYKMF